MKRTATIFLLLLILFSSGIYAQGNQWTLEDCIKYAIANNIGLKRQRLQSETAETNFLQSKLDILPSLNFGSQANMGFGRAVNPVDNSITFNQTVSNSFYMSSSVNIFNGFVKMNTMLADRFMVKAGLESEKIARNKLVADILGQYYQVLYAKGLEEASKMQLDLSEKQLFRISKMVETGKEAISKKYEIDSRVSADRLTYTIAQNTTSQAVTTLKQMLQLQPGTEFDILMPDLNNMIITDLTYNTDSIYSIASEVLPRLKAINFELQASKKQYAVSKGNISPSLVAGGSIYTGFYNVISDASLKQDPYTTQLKNNNSQSLNLTLNVPLFNNYLTGRSIKIARIRRDDTQLRLEQEKNNLYTEIENACLNYNRGKSEFAASVANFEYNKKSFGAVEKKFESGLVDVTDYSAAKTTLFSAETEALRTKLQLIIRKLAIELYATGEYENLIMN